MTDIHQDIRDAAKKALVRLDAEKSECHKRILDARARRDAAQHQADVLEYRWRAIEMEIAAWNERLRQLGAQ